MRRYLIVIEKTKNNFGAHAPDLPGCVATGKTREETIEAMRGAIEFHIEGLTLEKLPIPEAQSSAEYVSV